MVAEKFPELMALPDNEKLQCAAELWASVVGDPVDKDPAMVELIESRLADYRAHPERVVPLSEVKASFAVATAKANPRSPGAYQAPLQP